MNPNQELIHRFYTCFQNKDYKGMQECYANNASFSDSVFKDLNGRQTKAMWEMLIKNGKDLTLEFSGIEANETTGSAHWEASYTFSKTGNKVVNKIDAQFKFEKGKIVKHTDYFNFYVWAKQALGTTGLLLGWTPFIKNNVQAIAMNNLNNFMNNSK